MAKRGKKSKAELFKKAIGQDNVEIREEVKNKAGEVIGVIITNTHIPPDVDACMEYLTTYCGNKWKK